MINRYRLTVVLLAFVVGLTAVAAESASEYVAKVSKQLSSGTYSISFTASGNAGTANCKMTVNNSKFLLETPEIAVWFDGKTQWTLNRARKEVSISQPDADELSQINPMLILNRFVKSYKAEFLKGNSGVKTVKLTSAKRGSDISTAVVNFNASTSMPQSIVLTLSSGNTASIKISSIKKGKNLSSGVFTYDVKKHPGIEVIDLR